MPHLQRPNDPTPPRNEFTIDHHRPAGQASRNHNKQNKNNNYKTETLAISRPFSRPPSKPSKIPHPRHFSIRVRGRGSGGMWGGGNGGVDDRDVGMGAWWGLVSLLGVGRVGASSCVDSSQIKAAQKTLYTKQVASIPSGRAIVSLRPSP